ncbi:MAG: NAD-dependent epimerase/dehydratase family protein [Candidatus Levyibacteriota bacterium]
MSAPLIAVTGATGFIGRALCEKAASRAQPVRALVRDGRRAAAVLPPGIEIVETDLETAGAADLTRALAGAGALVHLAGRAHVLDERAADPDAQYRRANVDATARLAEAAVAGGVARLVFASTIKVNGEWTVPGRPFRPDDPPAPEDAYARSKLAAEMAITRIAQGTPTLPVILRLPLVYGARARGNFRRLVDAVSAGRWLPLGAIDNRRSLLGLPNLLDAIDAALAGSVAPAAGAAGERPPLHLIADAGPVSTPDLVRAIARALGVAPHLVPVPVAVLRLAGALTGRVALVDRLTRSLEADSTSFTDATGWRPRPFAIDAAMLEPRSSG